ncbi:hypothetical protein [Sphingobacterium sp. MYb388]|uniref:hypothetical protein n=1 Tax=Sphingobacterium sp. MYb388 TaxID=2745437 RepID=UPI0030A7D4AE
MKEAIREKINELINKGIESEAECVYLLSQLRKYREQQSISGYHNLSMCMNWALHSSIDRGAVKNLLKDIHDFLAYKDAKSDNLNFDGFEELQNKLLFVQPLRVELLKFLDTNGFDISICIDTDKYEMFLQFFARVIEDTPLLFTTKTQSVEFSQISVSKISDFDEPIKYNWIITSDKATIELNPFSN